MRTVYLGLGTNLEDRDRWLDEGLKLLEGRLVEQRSIRAMTLSPRYETDAWGMAEGTPAFLNMVVALETNMPLPELLSLVLDIERECGRVRPARAEGYTNRTLDLDVLCTENGETWNGKATNGQQLEVPHPRMTARRFVLQPLSDLDPNLLLDGTTVAQALQACDTEPAVRLHVPTTQPSERT
ncbi:MAG: 2-amino-4-hydroxy-6-hydroxymethyldihydropteridine diphosphokinase [Bacteroidetes bacterium]|nr:2-amino-4-hydroxy-6-hydroxymethyldihydropteridine diphosphokinase [Bacteroidota bacterium]MDA0904278.1 2-amino-4-hydroxy-6-hydroxymethyldihydropteridine diphosphokinase [Bacteroidota bacterium]MDA1241860.1 2-amino-4-hydroxy-6-hydroxymethyldihydropteridine diphosphokinase [Bacteroidota bacterium]